MAIPALLAMTAPSLAVVAAPPATGASSLYVSSRAPLRQTPLIRLPSSSFRPGGWVKRTLELQRDGLAGHLGEISLWLTKKGNAWLSADGSGEYGWEEVPYWLRGYERIGFVLRDEAMKKEARTWIDGALSSIRPDGSFGPLRRHREGMIDLWGQMLMVQALQAWHEETGDPRVISCLTGFFKWELSIPDERFLKDYWENSRGGDNLASVFWLYNRTGEPFLLDLARKIDSCTADWRMKNGSLPNHHNVNVAQGFRHPATMWLLTGKRSDLQASYRAHDAVRQEFGQVPGGMFGADENARPGCTDPRQATETCGFVEQIGSDSWMASLTADAKWTANMEDVAFNSLPAAFTPDYKALRYLTAPNLAVSDSKNHAPGIANEGPFLLMNPFSSRCCQHNHSSAWVNYLEGTWMATQDNGLALMSLAEGAVRAKAGRSREVELDVRTKYPFDGRAEVTLRRGEGDFPLYILIPSWAKGARIVVGDEGIEGQAGRYVRILRTWQRGDKVSIDFPMEPKERVWTAMKNAVSVDYGPLTFSLRIEEEARRVDGEKTTQGDSGWQKGVDQSLWPSEEILPKSDWNYGLVPGARFKVVRHRWPKDGMPWTLSGAPIEIRTTGRQIPGWGLDETGLVAVLPQSPVKTGSPLKSLTLVPMGAARLRISSFPVAEG